MKKEVNTTVGLWSFIFVIAISLSYLNRYVWSNESFLVFTGGYVLSFFMFLFGYKLVSYYKSKDEDSKKSASTKAWNYTKNNIKKYYPVYLFGVTLAFVVRNIINKTKLINLFGVFMDSIWEFLGLSQIGAVGIREITTLNIDTVRGFTHLWNQPLWIVSALVISGLFLYYILCKNEDLFKGIIGPLIIVITYAGIGLGGVDNFGLSNIFIPESILRVMAGVSLGMLSYYVVEYFKKKKFDENMMMTFSIVHMLGAIFFLYTIYAGITWNELTNGVFMYIFFIVLMTGKDYIAVLYNKSSLCTMLGKISFYYYAIFIVFIFLIQYWFPELGYGASIVFNLLFSLGFSFIMYVLCRYREFEIKEKGKK